MLPTSKPPGQIILCEIVLYLSLVGIIFTILIGCNKPDKSNQESSMLDSLTEEQQLILFEFISSDSFTIEKIIAYNETIRQILNSPEIILSKDVLFPIDDSLAMLLTSKLDNNHELSASVEPFFPSVDSNFVHVSSILSKYATLVEQNIVSEEIIRATINRIIRSKYYVINGLKYYPEKDPYLDQGFATSIINNRIYNPISLLSGIIANRLPQQSKFKNRILNLKLSFSGITELKSTYINGISIAFTDESWAGNLLIMPDTIRIQSTAHFQNEKKEYNINLTFGGKSFKLPKGKRIPDKAMGPIDISIPCDQIMDRSTFEN